ncbi:hypothetical protein SBRCBS47491_009862 [Sporothrix bragantina]|uniref:Major facilitator superfamily (MFS) profile domain-containing protein n=1 Tax=Sporothrix bragantina TaxID=671064 RepID=A0ABP0CY82_9PEZI
MPGPTPGKNAVDAKPSAIHDDLPLDNPNAVDMPTMTGFESDERPLRPGYYRSAYFLGSMLSVGLGVMAGVGGFALAAPLLGVINADIGPSENITWVSLTYTLTLAVGLLLVGRLTDIFGRRWFFIGGQLLALVGCVVSATAKSVNVLIGGITIIGIAASTQLSFSFILGELIPMKWRFLGNAYLYVYAIPFSGLAPIISQSFATRTAAGWRWCFYVMIILNGLSLASYLAFYHPPTFNMLNGRRSRATMVKNFDYVGTVLFTGGMVVFLLGLSWGGNLYPWSSAAVIATIVVGAVTLMAFGLYEAYMPIQEPLVPMHIFRNKGWTASTVLLSVGASVYYAFSIVWPQMASTVYGASGMRLGWMSCIVPGAITLGQITGGVLAKWIGHTKYQTMFVITTGGALLAAVAAASPDNVNIAIGLLICGCFFIGWNESVTLVFAGMCLTDQKEIGTAVGLAGSVRSAISTLATTIYTVVLSNRLKSTISNIVVPAILAAGLLSSSVKALLAGLAAGGDGSAMVGVVPGATQAIVNIARDAYKDASLSAFKTVFLTSIAFTGIGMVVSLWAPNVQPLMTDQVAVLILKKRGGEGDKAAENVVVKEDV